MCTAQRLCHNLYVLMCHFQSGFVRHKVCGKHRDSRSVASVSIHRNQGLVFQPPQPVAGHEQQVHTTWLACARYAKHPWMLRLLCTISRRQGATAAGCRCCFECTRTCPGSNIPTTVIEPGSAQQLCLSSGLVSLRGMEGCVRSGASRKLLKGFYRHKNHDHAMIEVPGVLYVLSH